MNDFALFDFDGRCRRRYRCVDFQQQLISEVSSVMQMSQSSSLYVLLLEQLDRYGDDLLVELPFCFYILWLETVE